MTLTESMLKKIILEVMNEKLSDSEQGTSADAIKAVVKYYTEEYSKKPTTISKADFDSKVKKHVKEYEKDAQPDLIQQVAKNAKAKLESKGYTIK